MGEHRGADGEDTLRIKWAEKIQLLFLFGEILSVFKKKIEWSKYIEFNICSCLKKRQPISK